MNGEQINQNQKTPIKKLNLIQVNAASAGAATSSSFYESSDDTEELSADEHIRVGREFQVTIPDFIPVEERDPDLLPDRETIVWGPNKSIDDDKMEQYLNMAKEDYGYTIEQALGLLFFHKHDANQATVDLANFRPTQTVWTPEEKVLFEQAFQFHGKNFNKIKQMFPGKPIAKLIQFYYLWKKQSVKTSVMDINARKRVRAPETCTDEGVNHDSSSDSDGDDDMGWVIHRGVRREANSTKKHTNKHRKQGKETDGNVETKLICSKCKAHCSKLYKIDTMDACRACVLRWRKTRNSRETAIQNGRSERLESSGVEEIGGKIMRIDQKDLAHMTSRDGRGVDLLLSKMDQKLGHFKRLVQFNKQYLEEDEFTEQPTPIEENPPRAISSKWTDEELQLAVEGIKLHGLDFQTIAEIIGTKTADHVSSFFTAYNETFELDLILKKYKKNNFKSIDLNQDDSEISVMN